MNTNRSSVLYCLYLALFGLVPCPNAIAQDTGNPKFDVASIKLSHAENTNWTYSSPYDGYVTENMPLADIICWAWHIRRFQLTGAPKWIEETRYDVHAKADQKITNDERMRMVRSLLAERFHLEVKNETKPQAVYALVIGKGGPRLKPNDCRFDGGSKCGGYSWGGKELSGTGVQLAELASMLTDSVDRPVVDKTGLSGRFDFKLHWTPEEATVYDAASPSIFTALQEQLGLRLESQRGPVEMLVVEHVEPPTEN